MMKTDFTSRHCDINEYRVVIRQLIEHRLQLLFPYSVLRGALHGVLEFRHEGAARVNEHLVVRPDK